MTEIDKEAIKAAAREQAWDEGKECQACGGGGSVPGGRKLIHARSLHGLGADWDLGAVEEFIDKADSLEWRYGVFGPMLIAKAGGDAYGFEITQPGGAA